MPAPPPEGPDRREIRVVLALTLLAAAIRFFRLGAQSLWIDEFLMIQRASLGEPFRWSDWLANPQGPLPALLLRLSAGLFGTSETALRLPSALAGTLTVPLVYFLARRFGRGAAGPAALLAALSPFLVWYSQEARHYAVAFLAAAWAALALLDLVEEGPRPRTLLSYGAALLVGLLSNLSLILAAAAHGLALLLTRPRLVRTWLLAVLPVFLLLLPWVWVAVTQNLNLEHVTQGGSIPVEERLRGETTFSWLGIPYAAFVFFAGYSLGPSLTELHAAPRPETVLSHAGVIAPLAAGAMLLVGAGLAGLRRRRFPLVLLLLWIAVPLAGVIVLSWRNAKVFNARYVASVLPLLLAVAGLGFDRLRRRGWLPAIVAGALVLGPCLLALRNNSFSGRYAREDIRSAARLLAGAAGEDDVILGQGAARVVTWYYHGPAVYLPVYDGWLGDEEGLARRVARWSRGRRACWLLVSRPWQADPDFRLKRLLEARYGPGTTHRFDGVLLVRYELAGKAAG